MIKLKDIAKALFIAGLFAFIGCTNTGKEQRNELIEQTRMQQQVEKLNEADLLTRAIALGDSLSMLTQNALSAKLMSAIQANGVSQSISFCSLEAVEVVDSLTQTTGAQITRVSHKFRNENAKPDSLASILLEAYAQAIANGETPASNAQMDKQNSIIVYNKPIIVNNALCLNCHGESGTQVNNKTLEAISVHYPNDNATGFKLGDLRGMWQIKIPIKKLQSVDN